MAIFLYTFIGKMGENVEENRGVAIFLPFFGEKSVFGVEENEGVAIFLPLFDKNVIFRVEENEGVPVFLYSDIPTPDHRTKTKAESACGRRMEKSRGAPGGGACDKAMADQGCEEADQKNEQKSDRKSALNGALFVFSKIDGLW